MSIEGGDFVAHASAPTAFSQAIEDGFPYPIKMMWIQSSNTLSCPSQDSPRVMKAMQNIPFIVNADPYITPTSVALADILLPVAMSAERNSARTWWTPLPRHGEGDRLLRGRSPTSRSSSSWASA